MLTFFPSTTLRINFKWFVLLIDVGLSVFGFIISNYILHEFYINNTIINLYAINLPYIVFARVIAFLIFETHIVSFRYVNIKDLLGVFIAVLFGSVLIFLGYLVNIYTFKTTSSLSLSLLFTDFLCVFFLLTTYRLILKAIFGKSINTEKQSKRALIYGIDNTALFIKRYLDSNSSKINVVGFISDFRKNKGKVIENLPVSNFNDLKSQKFSSEIDFIIGQEKSMNYLNRIFTKVKKSELGLKIVSFPDSKLKVSSYNNYTSKLNQESFIKKFQTN